MKTHRTLLTLIAFTLAGRAYLAEDTSQAPAACDAAARAWLRLAHWEDRHGLPSHRAHSQALGWKMQAQQLVYADLPF